MEVVDATIVDDLNERAGGGFGVGSGWGGFGVGEPKDKFTDSSSSRGPKKRRS